MSKNKRKQYSAQVKAKVFLEAIRGEKTLAELASRCEVHLTMINRWKHQLQEGASDLFGVGQEGKEIEPTFRTLTKYFVRGYSQNPC